MLPSVTFDNLSQCDFPTLARYAKWLGVELPEGEDGPARRKLAMKIVRAFKRNQTKR
jgi:hypothetical protein